MTTNKKNDLTQETLRGALFLVSGQSFSRLLTFIGNVLLLRIMNDTKPLGIASTEVSRKKKTKTKTKKLKGF